MTLTYIDEYIIMKTKNIKVNDPPNLVSCVFQSLSNFKEIGFPNMSKALKIVLNCFNIL